MCQSQKSSDLREQCSRDERLLGIWNTLSTAAFHTYSHHLAVVCERMNAWMTSCWFHLSDVWPLNCWIWDASISKLNSNDVQEQLWRFCFFFFAMRVIKNVFDRQTESEGQLKSCRWVMTILLSFFFSFVYYRFLVKNFFLIVYFILFIFCFYRLLFLPAFDDNWRHTWARLWTVYFLPRPRAFPIVRHGRIYELARLQRHTRIFFSKTTSSNALK